ncbi:MAG: hypothetical protein JXO22_09395, partial [Phycisphaerae bacterium]|nr:hypothetical protein [Phycisphaerae bacterium]
MSAQMIRSRPLGRSLAVVSIAIACAVSPSMAAFPRPLNDTPATAELITTIPAVLTGANVNGDDTISATSLAGLTSVTGADVFYSFTPPATGDYWLTMIPWVEVPVYASSGGTVPVPNLCVYVREADTGTFVAGSDANVRGQPDTVVTTLTGGVEYEIVVDSTETVQRGQEFEFTLVVNAAPVGSPEDCFTPGLIPNELPTAVVGTLTGAVDDVT